jgi:hypothetical protein
MLRQLGRLLWSSHKPVKDKTIESVFARDMFNPQVLRKLETFPSRKEVKANAKRKAREASASSVRSKPRDQPSALPEMQLKEVAPDEPHVADQDKKKTSEDF